MGHFTISLPNQQKAEVRWGKIIKREKLFLNLLFPWKKLNREEKTGYIIKVEPGVENIPEFRFFKTNDGYWSHDVEGKIKIESETAKAIQQAIEVHERLYN